jgi:Ni/Co efflux regulator RcnB
MKRLICGLALIASACGGSNPAAPSTTAVTPDHTGHSDDLHALGHRDIDQRRRHQRRDGPHQRRRECW